MVVVGNKFDLNENREVSYEEAMDFCAKKNIPFFESSAKTKFNVDELFDAAIRLNRNKKEINSKEKKEKKDCVIS
jgi:GTPase SAR1 family protein